MIHLGIILIINIRVLNRDLTHDGLEVAELHHFVFVLWHYRGILRLEANKVRATSRLSQHLHLLEDWLLLIWHRPNIVTIHSLAPRGVHIVEEGVPIRIMIISIMRYSQSIRAWCLSLTIVFYVSLLDHHSLRWPHKVFLARDCWWLKHWLLDGRAQQQKLLWVIICRIQVVLNCACCLMIAPTRLKMTIPAVSQLEVNKDWLLIIEYFHLQLLYTIVCMII